MKKEEDGKMKRVGLLAELLCVDFFFITMVGVALAFWKEGSL